MPERCWLSTAQTASYRSHPYALDAEAAAVLLTSGGRTLGRFGFLPGRLRIGEATHRVMWGSDWRVAPDVRGTSAAGALMLKAIALCPDLLGFGPSADALRIYRAARFQRIVVPRFVQPLRGRSILIGRAPRPVAEIAGAIIDRGIRVVRGPATDGRRCATLPPDLDGLDAAAAISFPRDRDELLWATSTPWLDDVACLAIEIRDAGALRGWALCRLRSWEARRIGTILRAEAAADRWADLFRLAAAELTAAGADTLELYATAAVEQDAARRIGCIQRGSLDLVARLTPPLLEMASRYGGLDAARLQYGEGDVLFA